MKKKIERKMAKQSLAPAGQSPAKIEWQPPRVKNRHGNIFADSETAREFKRMHRGIFSTARKIIQEKLGLIEKGKIVVNKECTVAVQAARTGKFSGKKNFLTMKVTAEGKEIFVKISNPHLIKANVSGLVLADEFLGKKSYKFGKFNVRVILPQKAVTFRGVSYLATNFLRPGEVELVSEMENAGEIKSCLKNIEKELSRIGVTDVLPENAFYHRKTGTILLFDLMARGGKNA